MIDPDTKKRLTALLQLGCAHETAAAFCSLSTAEMKEAINADPDWRRDVERSEASCEVSHLSKLQEALQDSKNWRISQWWLESRWPERYARKANTVTDDQLAIFVDAIATVLADEIADENERQQVVVRLAELLAVIQSD